jgi:ABC-2 type transport system permease protein
MIFISFGLISASFIIVLKKGDPLGWLITSTNAIFGGAFFPVDVMPPWLEMVARFVPAKYSLDALRLTIIQGYSLPMISKQILILLAITVIMTPLSIKLFLLSVEKAKKDGTLVHY